MDAALSLIGYSQKLNMVIYKICAAILHLGNVEVQEGTDGQIDVTEASLIYLETVASLLSVDESNLKNVLLKRPFNVNNIQET